MNCDLLFGEYLLHRILRRAEGGTEIPLVDWLRIARPNITPMDLGELMWRVAGKLEQSGLQFRKRADGIYAWEPVEPPSAQ